MQLFPVLDILNGVVVRGVAGKRNEYGPIESCLTRSVQPIDIARAIQDQYGWSEFYVADLDAIQFAKPNDRIYRQLIAEGFRLWIDAGVTDAARVVALLDAGVAQVIVGLESCPSPKTLRETLAVVPHDRLVFSLDLKDGTPLASLAWGDDPVAIAVAAVECGVKRMIVLDLAGVGVDAGVPTVPLCRHLRAQLGSEIRLITGGGVRGVDDLHEIEQAGVDGVLLASVLHRPGFQVGA